jgi:hypothetical protein
MGHRAMSILSRTYPLPHGYTVEFSHSPGRIFEARWSPDVPRIRKARHLRKFLEAYRAVRREFLQEMAALIGGNVAVFDTDEQLTCETILAPTKH